MRLNKFLVALFLLAPCWAEPRWSADRANDWYAAQAWPVGCNFIPSSAINELEMWQEDTFDPATIDRELAMAESLGMNTTRVFLHNLLWEEDAIGFKMRIDRYLELADKHHIKTIFVLFDSCWNDDPKLGPQPKPKPGMHNSGWLRAPGSARLFDSRTWGPLQAYVQGILKAYGQDSRVLAWDLFNEPSNSGYRDAVMPLLKSTFEWAKEVNPDQPLTSGPWEDHPMSTEYMLDNSDVVTFHSYDTPDKLEAQIDQLAKRGRPMICTEYMARTRNSTFQSSLPLFRLHRVGAINWGLVKGKTNTIFEWSHPMPDKDEPPVWFHDIFRPDGTPYDPKEVEYLRSQTRP